MIKTKIIIEFKGIKIEGTIDEIRELKAELDSILNTYTTYYPTYPIPSYPTYPTYPYYDIKLN